MDSRTREARDAALFLHTKINEIISLLTAEPEHDNDEISPVERAYNNGFLDGQQAAKQDAEPEPCEDALETIPKLTNALDGWIRAGWSTAHIAGDLLIFWLPDRAQVVDKRAEELERGDSWMERAKAFVENGGCPICFATDEDGHTKGCEYGKAEKEVEKLRAQVETLMDKKLYNLVRVPSEDNLIHLMGPDASKGMQTICGYAGMSIEHVYSKGKRNVCPVCLKYAQYFSNHSVAEALSATEPNPTSDDFKRFEKRSGITTDVGD